MSNDTHIPPVVLNKTGSMDSTLEDMLVECWADIGLFGKTFLPERFSQQYTYIHQTAIDFINAQYDEQRRLQAQHRTCGIKACVIGGRGVAKTSWFQLAVPAREILLGDCPLYAPVTKSLASTVLHTENLRRTLNTSNVLRGLLGRIRPAGRGMEEAYGRDCWVVQKPSGKLMCVLPRGVGQPVRGIMFGNERLYLCVLDDLEDDEEVFNPEIREGVRRFVFAEVTGAFSQFEAECVPWALWVCDSVKHPDCLVEHIARRPDFRTLRIPICDENFQTLAPDFRSQESLNSEIAVARSEGILDWWVQENMARAGAPENAPFQASDRQYYKESDPPFVKSNLTTIVTVDPANTRNPRSCKCGITVSSVDPDRPAIYIREVQTGRWDPEEQVMRAVGLCQKYDALALGVEVTGPRGWIVQPFTDVLMVNRMFHVRLVLLNAKGGSGELGGEEGAKVARSLPMSSYYKWHVVWHNSECPSIAVLEAQQDIFPNCTEWDALDSAAHLLGVLSELGLHFFDNQPQVPMEELRREQYRLGRDDMVYRRRKTRKSRTLAEEVDEALSDTEPLVVDDMEFNYDTQGADW